MELEEINQLTHALYKSITFSEGEQPKLHLLKDFFLPEGHLVNNNGENPLYLSVNSFIHMMEGLVRDQRLRQFSEVEISSQTHVFGKIAQRFSTYEARFDPAAIEPATVGINSLQLLKINGKWWVYSLVWNDQDDSLLIPPEYR